MKRSGIGLDAVLDWNNLLRAFYLAARGKRLSKDAGQFRDNLHRQLHALRQEVLSGRYVPSKMVSFRIRDPKPRLIYAPCFKDRVLHHALMFHVGPVLDRALVFDTYACRTGKGTLAAVQRCQRQMMRFSWYCKIDIRAYFASIDQPCLKQMLRQRLKNPALLSLIDMIIDSFHVMPGKGLPIGSLTSQHLANFYLSGLDRYLLETCRVSAMVRYMDDVIWWAQAKHDVRTVLLEVERFVQGQLGLQIKSDVEINRSALGVTFCGYRIKPDTLSLTRRKKYRYTRRRRYWEQLYLSGAVNTETLQSGYASVLSATQHGHSIAWRRQQLQRCPPHPDVLEA